MPVGVSANGASPDTPVGVWREGDVGSPELPQGSWKYPPMACFTSSFCEVIHITRKNAIIAVTKSA
jgi:hypothetical protein